MAPAIGQGFTDPPQFEDIDVPVLIIGAENDKIAPIKTNAMHYHKLIGHSKFHLLSGKTGHYVFLNEAKKVLKAQAPTYFFDDASVNRQAIHEKVIEIANEFFRSSIVE